MAYVEMKDPKEATNKKRARSSRKDMIPGKKKEWRSAPKWMIYREKISKATCPFHQRSLRRHPRLTYSKGTFLRTDPNTHQRFIFSASTIQSLNMEDLFIERPKLKNLLKQNFVFLERSLINIVKKKKTGDWKCRTKFAELKRSDQNFQ